jgi:hypothetical protein
MVKSRKTKKEVFTGYKSPHIIDKPEVIFEPIAHTYTTLDGRQLKSVTTLLKEQGIGSDFKFVDADVLKKAADKGSYVHKEIKEYFETAKCGISVELGYFLEYADRCGITAVKNEVIYFDDYLAGTADIFFSSPLFGDVLGDFKTGSTVDKNYCAWQLSIYDYLRVKEFRRNKPVDRLIVYHLRPEGMKTIELTEMRIPTAEIEKLIECSKNGEVYQPLSTVDIDEAVGSAIISSDEISKISQASKAVEAIEVQLKKAKEIEAELKEKLLGAMEANQIKVIKTKAWQASYVSPSERQTIDTKAVKLKYPEVAADCTKKTLVAASLRIKLLEGAEVNEVKANYDL